MTKALESAFTMDEAAGVLRISRRSLQDLVKRHHFYYPNGRRKLFTESDITALREAMRREAEEQRERNKCPSNSFRRVPGKPLIGRSGARTSGPMWTELQRRLTELRQQGSLSSGKTKSKVVPLPNPANRHS